MLRYGTITETDPNKGLARVSFPEEGIVSGWLPVIQSGTLKNKSFHTFDVSEHVACLMDENAENGVIVGAIYSKSETPGAVNGADKVGVAFESGDYIEYDRAGRKYKIKTNTTEFSLSNDGPKISKGSESLKKLLVDLLDTILTETHPTAVGPTGPPINAAAYTALKTRISNFFES